MTLTFPDPSPQDEGLSIASLTAFASHCGKGIVVWDQEMRLVAVNPEASKTIGVDPEEFQVGISYDQLALRLDSIARTWDPDAAWEVLQVTDFASARRQVERDTGSISVMPGGNEAGVQVERMILDDRWMLSILTDLGALGNKERETARQRLYLKTILENLTDGVMQIDQGDRVMACNKRLFELFGVDPNAFTPGLDVAEFARLHGDLETMTPADRQAAIQERSAFARGEMSERRTFSVTRELSTGMILNVVRTALPNGGAVIAASDATESVQLARQRQMLKTVIDTIDEGVTLVEPDQSLGFVNDKMLELYDIDREDVRLGEHALHFARASGDLKGLPAELVEKIASNRVRFGVESPTGTVKRTHTLRNGRSLGVTRTILDDGSAVATYRDITQETRARKLLEQAAELAEKANRLKSDFLATVTHDLRTPLHGVLGMASLLERTRLDDHQTRILNLLVRSSRHMVDLIDGLLSISSVETGDLSLELHAVDLHELAVDCVEIIRPDVSRKGLQVNLEENFCAGSKVLADGKRLTQVLLNLLGNAVKFTDSGYVKLAAQTSNTTDGLHTKISVVDSGPGIAAVDLERIFESFTQLDGNCDARRKGVGLGLSIAKSLSALMGGDLSVNSSPGQGTVFTLSVTFPRADSLSGTSEKPAA